MVEKEEAGGGISEEEAAQYDRQIRLWGLEAQKRLRASRVLLVGMKGLGAEIAKNLILAGVKGLTMLDHEQVSPEDPGAQFLIRTGSVGRNRAEASLERAQNLNPMVDVKVDTENIENKPEAFFTQFDAVCLTCCSRDVIVKVDQICHKNSIKFFTGDVFGYHGYTFANLGEHEFVEEKTKVAKVSQGVEDGPDTKRAKLDSSETTMVKKKAAFCSVKEALEVDWSSDKAKAALKRTASDYFLLQDGKSAHRDQTATVDNIVSNLPCLFSADPHLPTPGVRQCLQALGPGPRPSCSTCLKPHIFPPPGRQQSRGCPVPSSLGRSAWREQQMPRVKVMCHSSAGREKRPSLPAACDQAGRCEWRGSGRAALSVAGAGAELDPRGRVWASGGLHPPPPQITSAFQSLLCPLLFVNFSLLMLVRMFHLKGESQAQESLDIF
nr:SUMO-activating enzyme subunit 1 isoform X1 [Equus caballus]